MGILYHYTITHPHDCVLDGEARLRPPSLLSHANWWVDHQHHTNMRTMVVSPRGRLPRLPTRNQSRVANMPHKVPLGPERSAFAGFMRTQTLEPLSAPDFCASSRPTRI